MTSAAYLASVEASAATRAIAHKQTVAERTNACPERFTTDAAFKSLVFRHCPNVAVRKDNEWNEWNIQYTGAERRADWLHGDSVKVDRAHDKADQMHARYEAFVTACDLQIAHDEKTAEKSAAFIAQIRADLA